MKSLSVKNWSNCGIKMKKTRTITFVFAFIACCFSLTISHAAFAQPTKEHLLTHIGKYPNYPRILYGTGPQAELIKKGEYLAKAGDCISCHTQKGGLPFAGGLPISTPFGIIYSPNITSDKNYGIGHWTTQQFIKAIREGVAPDGSNYFPVFPYPYFTKITDDDLIALKAYFDAVPPVPLANKELEMAIPFRWRFLQFFWKLMFFDFEKGAFKPDPSETEQWNRGAYLVQGLGHCGMCHTPLNVLGAAEQKYALTGGFGSGNYAPNISFSRLVNTSISEVVNVFMNDKLLSGGSIIGPMSEVVHNSLEYLTKNDLEAIAIYLKSVKSEPPNVKETKITSETGKNVYNKYCSGCHDTGAGDAPKIGDAIAWAPRFKQGINNLYSNAVSGIGNMPPRGGCSTCSDGEIEAAVNYIVDNTQITQPVPAAKVVLPQSRIALGKKVYTEVCSICHQEGKLGAPRLGDKAAWAPIIKKNIDTLVLHTIKGYKGMPAKGACYNCSDNDLIAAVIYMVHESKAAGNFTLW
jgi:cytochrome c5